MLMGKKRTHPSTSTMKSGIIDSKSQLLEQRSKEVMQLFQQQTELTPNFDTLPTARLKPDADLSVYNTSSVKNFSVDISLLWSLASALYKNTVQTWIQALVLPGLSSQLEINQTQHASDPFVSTFTYLSFGQRDLASEEAKKNNEFLLAMYISHSEFKDVKALVKEYMNTLRTQGQWETMSMFHKRCCYILAGYLGYVDEDNFIVTERTSWQCTLGMYLWYGNRFDEPDSLVKYNKAFDESVVNIRHLKTIKNIARPDVSCLWYQLLQWWLGDPGLARLDSWPLDLVWLLSIYKPSSTIDSSFSLKWIETLERMDEAELAIYAALFMPSPEKQINYILRQCEWKDEEKLLNVYHIPSKTIHLAKALHAHDDWNFDEEYEILLQGELYEQAKMNLLFFLLPRYFKYDKASIEKCLSFVNAYPKDRNELIQHLQSILTYLLDDNMNTETSDMLSQKLKELTPEYGGRNTNELFKNLIEAMEL